MHKHISIFLALTALSYALKTRTIQLPKKFVTQAEIAEVQLRNYKGSDDMLPRLAKLFQNFLNIKKLLSLK